MKKRIYKRYRTRKKGGQRYWTGKKLKRGPPKLPLKKLKVWHTHYLQDPKTGLMEGRERAKIGERTGVLIDTSTGRIFGRFPKIRLKKP